MLSTLSNAQVLLSPTTSRVMMQQCVRIISVQDVSQTWSIVTIEPMCYYVIPEVPAQTVGRRAVVIRSHEGCFIIQPSCFIGIVVMLHPGIFQARIIRLWIVARLAACKWPLPAIGIRPVIRIVILWFPVFGMCLRSSLCSIRPVVLTATFVRIVRITVRLVGFVVPSIAWVISTASVKPSTCLGPPWI